MDDSKPKYLNSSDTPAFKKSRHLFALNFAKNSCSERVILCEGYMDVIALHAAGFENAVATLGTAITADHARILSKYTQRVVISYDADEAGQNAANKAMRMLGEVGMDVRVLKLNGAKDPDEYIQKFGPDRFRRVLEESRTGFEHKADRILSKYDLGEGSDKIRASNELCAMVAEYASPIEREVYLAYIGSKLELPIEILRNSVEQFRRRNRREQAARDTREAQATVKNFGDRVNPEAAQHPRAAAAEEAVIGLLLLYEEYRNAVQKGVIELCEEDFVTDFYRRVFASVMRRHESEEGLSIALLGAEFTPDEMGRIEKAEVSRRELSQYGPEVFRSAVEALKTEKRRLSISDAGLDAHLEFLREKKRRKELTEKQ